MLSGDSIFCATGITSGDLVKGVKINNNKYISETLVTHKSSNFKKVIRQENEFNSMISVSNKEWSERKIDVPTLANKLSQDNNFSQILSKLIISRNFNDEEIHSINYLKNTNFSNVFNLMKIIKNQ